MNLDLSNTHFKLAYDYVSTTNCSLYVSGKAGTGKTTFLKYVKSQCKKSMVVVAPTGVAAINAGGVTMHSFFQLPFGPYIPNAQTGFGMNEGVVDKNALFKNLRVNSTKRKILEELELLIIDEVSMLRSDTLDAIDTILKAFRRNRKPFGGVQLLFIGDLYQLPPVVLDNEKILLDQVYESPFFFDALILKEVSLIYIELKKIYRQNEQSFIDLLNKLRHNQLEEEDFIQLNKRYQPNFISNENDYITLCSHNYKADIINSGELKKIKTEEHIFKGELKGDFYEKQLPTDQLLLLKEGAQVMFVKNDSSPEKKYYNGKIAVISKIEGGNIYVRFKQSDEDFFVPKESWENISYSLNKTDGNIEEKVIGEFIQYPLRLAWAITIHKSQGLTFDKVIIDAGSAFASGQVYVALSRCTSLQGIILLSKISEHALHTEARIVDFSRNETKSHVLEQQLIAEKFNYESQRMIALFQWQKLLDSMYLLEEATLLSKNIPAELKVVDQVRNLLTKMDDQKRTTEAFIKQLENILLERNITLLKDRLAKGIHYFTNLLYDEMLLPLSTLITDLKTKSKLKKYNLLLENTYQLFWHKLTQLQEAELDEKKLVPPSQRFQKMQTASKATKPEKGNSPKETLAYFLSGKTIDEVATIRGLSISTIEKHLSEFIQSGELEIARFLSLEQLQQIHNAYSNIESPSLSLLKEALQDSFSFGELRMALIHFKRMEETSV